MTRDGDVDVLGPKNALLRAFPINDLGAQSLSSFQRSVGPVKPAGPFSTILRLPLVGAAKNHQWGPVSGCYDSFWPRILSVKRWIWMVNENCHNDSAPQQWPKLPMDSWGGVLTSLLTAQMMIFPWCVRNLHKHLGHCWEKIGVLV
jgi:hypothetical protein